MEEGNRELLLTGEPVTLYLKLTSGETTAYSVPVFTTNQTVGFTTAEFSQLLGFALGRGGSSCQTIYPTRIFHSWRRLNQGWDCQSCDDRHVAGVPEDVEVKFDVSFYDGETYTAPITIGMGQAATITGNYCGYQIKGYVTDYGTHAATENLAITGMHITAGYAGVNTRAQDQLVASPTGLSAVPLVNYTTWLRWSEPVQDDELRSMMYTGRRRMVERQN